LMNHEDNLLGNFLLEHYMSESNPK